MLQFRKHLKGFNFSKLVSGYEKFLVINSNSWFYIICNLSNHMIVSGFSLIFKNHHALLDIACLKQLHSFRLLYLQVSESLMIVFMLILCKLLKWNILNKCLDTMNNETN